MTFSQKIRKHFQYLHLHVYFYFFEHIFTLLDVHYAVQLSEVCYFIFNAINKLINYNTTFDPKVFL